MTKGGYKSGTLGERRKLPEEWERWKCERRKYLRALKAAKRRAACHSHSRNNGRCVNGTTLGMPPSPTQVAEIAETAISLTDLRAAAKKREDVRLAKIREATRQIMNVG